MWYMMRNPRNLKLRQFGAWNQDLNKYLPQFTKSDDSKNIPKEDLSEILLHVTPNGRDKQETMIGFNFGSEYFHDALEFSEPTEMAEVIYKGPREPSQNIQPKEYSNRASVWKKLVETASPTGPSKIHTSKCKSKMMIYWGEKSRQPIMNEWVLPWCARIFWAHGNGGSHIQGVETA